MRVFICVTILLTTFIACAEDGKIFVKSEPVGAEIFWVKNTENASSSESKGKTPALVTLPIGEQKILLKLQGYTTKSILVTVGKTITKPDVITLEKRTVNMDVVFEEGWKVLIDKMQITDVEGKPSLTPCTIAIPLGKHEITFAHDGWVDMIKQIEATENGGTVVEERKPAKGASKALAEKGTGLLVKQALPPVEEKMFLADLQTTAVRVGYGRFDPLSEITVDGKLSSKSFEVHANKQESVFVVYKLDGKYQALVTGYGFSDAYRKYGGIFTFSVQGDEKKLWESKGMTGLPRENPTVTIDVRGVQTLELRIVMKGQKMDDAHTIWIGPYLKSLISTQVAPVK